MSEIISNFVSFANMILSLSITPNIKVLDLFIYIILFLIVIGFISIAIKGRK